jgi:trans-aconitate methyltransferase
MEIGCGTGALTAAILTSAEPRAVVATDPSAGFVATARAQVQDPRVRFEVTDATALPPGPVDVVVSGLVVNFLPEPDVALAAMRAAAPDGVIAAYVWDYAEGMQLIRSFWDAAVAVDPAAAPLDEATRFPLCRPDELERAWRQAGLTDVALTDIIVPTVFEDFDTLWQPFLGGQGPAPTYASSLDDHARSALRDHFRGILPIASDGTIRLSARAWAVRGRSTSR